MANTRTSNSVKNISMAFLNQGLVTVLTFITRTVLIHELGAEYVGINGLFTNIISMLSLAQLGIDLAIPYSLYKPLADGDIKKISVLMRLYSRIYIAIGSIVLIVGFSLTPFLEFMVNEMPNIADIRLIYCLFVFNSGISYFWSYKGLLIVSDQKGYVLTKINNLSSVMLAFTQCSVLAITKDFVLYLVCNSIITIIKNVYISVECNKRYPYIKEKTNGTLQKEELDEIKRNIFAVSLYKLGTVLLNSIDGIIISKFLGVIINGYYANYTMITHALNSILSQISGSIVASIGNATATESEEYNLKLFKRMDFMNYWIYGICTGCLWVLINPFVVVWIGEQYKLNLLTVWALSMNFYTLGMLGITSAFRNTYGLFWYGKLRPLIMSFINLFLSLLLVHYIGIFGVVFATVISRVTTSVWYDPFIVYKYGFKTSVKKYYTDYIKRFLTINGLSLIISYFVMRVSEWNWIKWILIGIVVFAIYNFAFVLLYHNSEEFKYAKSKIYSILISKVKRRVKS